MPATWGALSGQGWFTTYGKIRHTPLGAALLHFAMDGSGTWHVKHLRDESDESGPYIAVALKFDSSS